MRGRDFSHLPEAACTTRCVCVCVLTGGGWVFLSSPATQRSACASSVDRSVPGGELRWLCSALSIRMRTQPVRGARVLPWPPWKLILGARDDDVHQCGGCGAGAREEDRV